MKTKLSLTILLSFVFYLLSSQVPQGFNYQAIARDGDGNLISDPFDIKVEIQNLDADTIFWIEEHNVTPNEYGLISFVVGQGIPVNGRYYENFEDIDWISHAKYLKTSIKYPGPSYTELGTTQIWAVPYSLVADNVKSPIQKLGIKSVTSDMEEALFEVKNNTGQTVFAVYNEGVRIYVDDTGKGAKGGFAIGSFGTDKGTSQPYMVVKPDTVRIYINKTGKGPKGGFAIGGYGTDKADIQDFLFISDDSVRIYIDNADTDLKGVKGGFAIGGYGVAKGKPQDLLTINNDSVRIYLDKGGPDKGVKGGFAIGGFNSAKGFENEYLRVTTDSVKVSKSLLIPRLTTEERDNLPFTPGEALIIFNMTESCMQIFKNNVWSNIWCFNCAPSFIIQPVDQTICSGENAVFFVSATGTNLSYQWQESIDNGITWHNISNGGSNPVYSGARGSTLNLLNIPVEYHNYKYRCVVIGSCPPDVVSNTVTLNVGSTNPIITIQPVDQQLSVTCTASFNVLSPGHGVSYQWQLSSDGGSIWSNIANGGGGPVYSGATSATLSLSGVPGTFNNNRFRCVVANLCGPEVTSDAAILTLNTTPAITVQPSNKEVYPAMNLTFSITTSGSGFIYQWQMSTNGGSSWANVTNGGTDPAYSGATSAILSLTHVILANNNFQYRCSVSHNCRPAEISNPATLSVVSSITVTDIEGNVYNTIGLGSQLWMSQNLKTIHYNDGALIPLVTDQGTWSFMTTHAYCWYNNNEGAYKNIYGALYNWYAVSTGKLCPAGWHVPTDAEWTALTTLLGGETVAGGKLKETGTSHWASPNTGATNETGFTALPSGYRGDTGYFDYLTHAGQWWSASALDANLAWMKYVWYNDSYLYRFSDWKRAGNSIRCVRNY